MSEAGDKTGQLLLMVPQNIRLRLQHQQMNWKHAEEMRFRIGQPVSIRYPQTDQYLGKDGQLTTDFRKGYVFSSQDMKEFLDYISNYSLYAYEEELKQGFITLLGGHRVGLVGQAVLVNGEIKTLRNISFANIRIAHEHIGIGETVLPYLYEEEKLCSTLIASPPCCGKTSLLRDLIRCISDGHAGKASKTVGVVDERSELAACYQGVPQNDIGHKTDVLDACPKSIGIEMLLRSMAPEVIAVDELGRESDYEAIQKARHCGCILLATVHGDNRLETWFHASETTSLRQNVIQGFERLIQLGGDSNCRFRPFVYRVPEMERLY